LETIGSGVVALLEKRFGARFRLADNTQSTQLGTTRSVIALNDPNRLGIMIVNLSANAMYVGPFLEVSSTRAFRLGPNGGSIVSMFDEDFILPQREWNGLAALANSDYLCIEILLLTGIS
jgi:hypothetical protein